MCVGGWRKVGGEGVYCREMLRTLRLRSDVFLIGSQWRWHHPNAVTFSFSTTVSPGEHFYHLRKSFLAIFFVCFFSFPFHVLAPVLLGNTDVIWLESSLCRCNVSPSHVVSKMPPLTLDVCLDLMPRDVSGQPIRTKWRTTKTLPFHLISRKH